MNAVQAVHKLLLLRHRYQSSICAVKTQIFIFLLSKPMERRKNFNCFFEFVSMDDLTFRQKQKKIMVTGTLRKTFMHGPSFFSFHFSILVSFPKLTIFIILCLCMDCKMWKITALT